MKLSERIDATGLTMFAEGGDYKINSEGWEHIEWEVTLRRPGRELKVQFEHGMRAGDPVLLEVVGDLLSNAQVVDGSSRYEEWAGEWSADPEEWPSRDTYKAQVDQAARLRDFLGRKDWHTWLYETERDEA